MLQQQVYVINTLLMIVDAVCVIMAGYGSLYLHYRFSGNEWVLDANHFMGAVLVVMFLNNYLMGKFKLYGDSQRRSWFQLVWSILNVAFFDFAFLSAGIFFLQIIGLSRSFLIYFGSLTFLLLCLTRCGFQLYFADLAREGFNARRILVVGNEDRGRMVCDTIECQLSWGHKLVGTLAVGSEDATSANSLGTIEDLPKVLRKHAIDEVIFALLGDRAVNLAHHLDICRKMGISATILPALWNPEDRCLNMEVCQGIPFLTLRTNNFNATSLLYKRVLDIVAGSVGTLLFLLIYPFIAIAIKFDSPGPVLFSQDRMGANGRIFKLYKFRTMFADAEARKRELRKHNEMNGALFKIKNDPRITRVGHFLRKTSLDEFPQFLNVLRGEMSLVGTRPPTLDEVEIYQPHHLKRISVKPGITGLWQVSGRNSIVDFDRVVELDCQYLDRWRFRDDLVILLKTFWVVLQRKGAV